MSVLQNERLQGEERINEERSKVRNLGLLLSLASELSDKVLNM
jgi:hypothetical protein